jgi:hypothetical protein
LSPSCRANADFVRGGQLGTQIRVAEPDEVAAGADLVLQEPVRHVQVLQVRLLVELAVVEAQDRLLVDRERDAEPRRDARVRAVLGQVLVLERVGNVAVRVGIAEREAVADQRRRVGTLM